MVPVLEEPLPETIERLGVLGALETRVTGEEKLELFSGLPALFRGFWGRGGGGFLGFLRFRRHGERVGMRGRRDGVVGSKSESKPL